MLTVSNLSKAYGSQHHPSVAAVRGVSFEVPDGTFFTLLGPSGCGKTTILRCIAGFERPDDGEIAIMGEVVYSGPQSRFVPPELRPIGMVFQSYAIWPHMTVFDNVAFPLRYGRQRKPRAGLTREVLAMLERVGLAEYAHRWATQLSGGQQQRLALARALIRHPKVLLLDEPLSNLDAKLRAGLRRELREFQRSLGITTVYVTHDQTEALSLSDAVAVMQNGRIVQIGPPREVYENPMNAFVATFMGDSNLLPASVAERGHTWTVKCAFGTVAARPAQNNGSGGLLLSVRPEDVEVCTEEPAVSRNLFQGVVSNVEFLGGMVEAAIRLGDLEVKTRTRPSLGLHVGMSVWVHLPIDRCLLVPGGELGTARSENGVLSID